MLKIQDVLNAMNCTRANIIDNLHGAAKQISRPICLGLKQNKENYDLICLNVIIYKSTCLEITSPWWNHLQII